MHTSSLKHAEYLLLRHKIHNIANSTNKYTKMWTRIFTFPMLHGDTQGLLEQNINLYRHDALPPCTTNTMLKRSSSHKLT